MATLAHRQIRVRTGLSGDGGSVAITFDDGPDPEFTPAVLDQLESLGVRATFFVVGHRAARHPELVRRIVSAGHALGSHSYCHAEPGSQGWRVFRDFRAGRSAVERVVDREVRLFRPPKGFIGPGEAVSIRLAGLVPWLWTLDPEDWSPQATVEGLMERTRGITSGDVVLLHDGLEGPLAPEALDRSPTVALLPGLVGTVRAMGLSFKVLPSA